MTTALLSIRWPLARPSFCRSTRNGTVCAGVCPRWIARTLWLAVRLRCFTGHWTRPPQASELMAIDGAQSSPSQLPPSTYGGVPWTAADARRAGTVHLGGNFEEIAATTRAVNRGQMPERPFVLVGQQYLADPPALGGQYTPGLELRPCPQRLDR